VVNYGSNTMTKVDARNFEILDNIETKSKPIGITIDNEKGIIWVACYSGKLMVYQDLNFNVSIVDQTIAALGNPADFIPIKTEHIPPIVEIKVVDKKPEEKIVVEHKEPPSNLSFHIVAGSFGSKTNAIKEAKRWKQKGYKSVVVKSSNGLNLVSIQASKDKQILKEKLVVIKQKEKIGLWIYSK
jgi:hypothetical protein